MAVNPAGIDELLGSGGVVAHLQAQAQAVAEEIMRIAPRRTGAYDRSIAVGEPFHDPKVGVVVPVGSSDPFWHLVEFGSANNEPYAPMRRALINLHITAKDIPKP